MMSRIFRFAGSTVFTAAGIAYVFLPPNTTIAYFDSPWPSIAWGVLFSLGGIVSAWGVFTDYPHTERLGVAFVVTATAVLFVNQVAVMFDFPITWTRMGGALFYLASLLWASERWWNLTQKVRLSRLEDGE